MKKEQGITLVALVVTVIILLILATITISTLTGNNGIIDRGYTAKEKTEIKQEMEIIGEATINSQKAIITSSNRNYSGNITDTQVAEECKNLGMEVVAFTTGDIIEVKVNDSGRIYKIDIEGGVTGPYITVEDENGGEIAGGGTSTDPYKIQSIEDLVELSNQVNGGKNYSGEVIELATDLDFKSILSYEDYTRTDFGDINGDGKIDNLMTELKTGTGFIAIGNSTNQFVGIFKGNNHTISNLYINTTNQYEGLFGYIQGGSVEELNLVNVQISGGNVVGGIAGHLGKNSKIIKCSVSGTIDIAKSYSVGGITGVVREAVIEDCINYAQITGGTSVGGIAGASWSSSVEKSINKGHIKGTLYSTDNGTSTGGIVGAFNDEFIENTGIINCANFGKVESEYWRIGGIAGLSKGKIENCYNIGEITGDHEVGEIAGANLRQEPWGDGRIRNSYFINTAKNSIVGQSYILNGSIDELSSAKTEQEMKSDAFLVTLNGENIEDVWVQDSKNVNNGYPALKWQLE